MATMLIQSVFFTFAPEDADKADAIFRELRDASRKEDGVIGFDVGRSREKPTDFALWEQYKDLSALDAHKATEHYLRLVLDGSISWLGNATPRCFSQFSHPPPYAFPACGSGKRLA
jgi:(4S)-4-hydroxy-5-phosphonooxypentane-2,3-dione isomerase